MNQTQDDLVFYFVNDCSTDDSLSILKSIIETYPNRLSQITIINNEKNIGPSDSRKKALELVQTEYVGFCDADDWIEPSMYEKMLNNAKKEGNDIVVCNYITESSNNSNLFQIIPSETPQESLRHLNDWHRFSYAMWNQICRTSIIKEQIREIIPTKLREDTYLMMRVYYYSKKIGFIPEAYYHYKVDNTNSLIHRKRTDYIGWTEQKENFDKIVELLYSKGGYKMYHKACNCFKFMLKTEYKSVFNSLREYYETYRESHWDAVKEYNRNIPRVKERLSMMITYNTNFFVFNAIQKRCRN